MTSNQNLETFVPVYDAPPERYEQFRQFTVEQMKRLANAVNNRVVGDYQSIELLAGKNFIPGTVSPTENRQVFRKVLDTGTLPNATTSTTAHGLTLDSRFSLVSLYGGAYDPSTPAAIPLPYVDLTALNAVEVRLTSTDVVIETAVDKRAYTRSYVIIEYLKEL